MFESVGRSGPGEGRYDAAATGSGASEEGGGSAETEEMSPEHWDAIVATSISEAAAAAYQERERARVYRTEGASGGSGDGREGDAGAPGHPCGRGDPGPA